MARRSTLMRTSIMSRQEADILSILLVLATLLRMASRSASTRLMRWLICFDVREARALSLAELDASFDDARYLTHVPEVIARLDSLIPTVRAPEHAPARKATANAHG